MAFQYLWNDAVLDWPEHGGLESQQKQHTEQQGQAVQPETQGCNEHDKYFKQLDATDLHGFFVLVRELPKQG